MAGLVVVETGMGKYGEDMDLTGGEVDGRMLGRPAGEARQSSNMNDMKPLHIDRAIHGPHANGRLGEFPRWQYDMHHDK